MNAQEKAAALVRAAGIVRAGWCQGAGARGPMGEALNPPYTGACQHCLASALSVATDFKPVPYTDVVEAVRNSPSCPTVEVDGKQEKRLITWNDSPGRTQDEVVALLETIAKELTQ